MRLKVKQHVEEIHTTRTCSWWWCFAFDIDELLRFDPESVTPFGTTGVSSVVSRSRANIVTHPHAQRVHTHRTIFDHQRNRVARNTYP